MIYRIVVAAWFLLWVSPGYSQNRSFSNGDPLDRTGRNCATVAYNSLLQHRYPQWAEQRNALERVLHAKSQTGEQLRMGANGIILRIPVVVHVVHHERNSQPGTGGNISNEQIQSQIEVLNEDYRRKPGTRGFNDNPVGADMEIEFFLATCDPNGNPTNGITRQYDSQTSWDVFSDDVELKSFDYWPSDQYLNIWVTSLKDNYIGYTQFPDMSGEEGLDAYNGPATTDGVVIEQRVFGRGTGTVTSSLYGKGRTTTHEIGHWLGLKHTWGDTDCGDDYCADTPPTMAANQSQDNECADVFSNCNNVQTRNMIENYLDYSPDVCMNLFTEDQKERVWRVLENSPRRKKLVENADRCATLPESEQLSLLVYPNPSVAAGGDGNSVTWVQVLLKGQQRITMEVYDALGRRVYDQELDETPSIRIDLPNQIFRAGVYFVRVTTSSGEKAVKRLLIVR